MEIRGLSCRVTALQLEQLFPGDMSHAGFPDRLLEQSLIFSGPWVGETQSEKQLYAMFPSPSCPYLVLALVSLLPGTSPWK